MKRLLNRRNLLALVVILAIALLSIYFDTRPRLAPGQAPLADIGNIEMLRAQFNRDAGQTRLVILVSPT
jgi:hypothetical protein